MLLFRMLLIVVTAYSGFAVAQQVDAPSFKRGQVAVYAHPDTLVGYQIIKYLPNAGISVVVVSPGRELGEVNKLRSNGKKAGLNRIMKAFAAANDPLYSFQWHFSKVQGEQAWDITSGNTTVVVGVLDTGLASQPGGDGIACVLPGSDQINGDNDPLDGHGHGTHVSGTIAQATNNSAGVAGLAHGSCVMPIKVLGDNGSGTSADIADGIYYAVNNGVSVINMSLGFNARFAITNDALMDPALDHASSQGVTVVCAAGNDGQRKQVSYPAIYPTTIAVGATDFNNRIPRYSNRGKGLDLVAPGGDTTRDDNGDGYGDGVLQETFVDGNWGYWFFQGTSMAAPHVAAAAAMLIANGTATSPDEVRQALLETALDIGDAGVDKTTGHGLLQIASALQWQPGLGGGGGCTDSDSDGWCVEQGDCDDNNAKVFPGANDSRGKPGRDGIDNDCNNIIDG